MGIRSYKPTSPARRYYSVSDFKEVTKTEPERSLTEHQTSTGGRNNNGRITTRFRGGATSSATASSTSSATRSASPPRSPRSSTIPTARRASPCSTTRTARSATHPRARRASRWAPRSSPAATRTSSRATASRSASSRRHRHPQRGAEEGQGRPARALRRRLRPAHGQGRDLGPGPPPQRRDPQGAPGLPRHGRPGLQRGSRQHQPRQGGADALARASPPQPRRHHETRSITPWAAARAGPPAAVTRARRGASSPRGTRRGTTSGRTG